MGAFCRLYRLAGVENLIFLRNCQLQSFLHLLEDNFLLHILSAFVILLH